MTRINGEQFNFEQFRKDHPEFSSCTDAEIISILNNSADGITLTSEQENSLFSGNIQTTAEEGISFTNSEADLLQLLESRVRKVENDSIAAQQNNGVVGKAWHWIKNTVGIGDSSDDVEEAQSAELKLVKEGNVKKAFEELTGVEYTKENIEAFKKGEIKTKSETALDEYKIGQEDSSDFAGDMVSGIASMGIYSFAIAAVATMGAPIALAAGAALGAAATIGAVVKVGTKAIDANLGDKKYESFGKDVLTGAVNGLTAPIWACFGGAFGKSAITRLGGKAIKEGADIVATNSSTSFFGKAMVNPMGNIYQGTLGQKATGYVVELGFDGAMSGATDATARAVYDGKSGEEILSDATTGAIGGAVGGIILGGAMKGISNAAHNAGVEVGSEINPTQIADAVIPTQTVADLAEEAIPTQTVADVVDDVVSPQVSEEVVESFVREVDESVSTVKPVVDENQPIVKVEKDISRGADNTGATFEKEFAVWNEAINKYRNYPVSKENVRLAYEKLTQDEIESLQELLLLRRTFKDVDDAQLPFLSAMKIVECGPDAVSRVEHVMGAKCYSRHPLKEHELVRLAQLSKEDGDFALKVLNLDIEKSKYTHVLKLLEENKKSPINLDACKTIIESDPDTFSLLDYLVDLIVNGNNNIEVVADYMKNYPEQYAHLRDIPWVGKRRELLEYLNADNVQVLNKLIENCPSDYYDYSSVLNRVTAENNEILLHFMEHAEACGSYTSLKMSFYTNMLKAFDQNPDITKALVDADIFFANTFELCKMYPDCIDVLKAVAEVASSLKNNSRKFDTTLREIVPKIKCVLENNKDIASERLVNIMRKFTQLYVDEPRFSYQYNNILTQNLENIEALLEIKDVNLISELQYRVLYKDKDFDLTPYIEVVKKYSSSAYNFTLSNLPFLKQLDELSDKYSFINSKFVSDFLSRSSGADLSTIQNIEPVVALLEKNKNLQLSPDTFVNMLKTNPQESLDILSGKYPSSIKPNSAQMYEQTFSKFANEAQKFGCKTIAELEAYVKTATLDRAAAGKLLGQIKKATLDDFEEFVPEDLRVFLYNENGVFTAANFEKILALINSNKELKAIFEYSMATKQELPGFAEIMAASIMAKDSVQFLTWEFFAQRMHHKLIGENAKEFARGYLASEKLSKVFIEKVLNYEKQRNTERYLELIKEMASNQIVKAEAQVMIQLARDIIGDGNIKMLIYDESIVKFETICMSLSDLHVGRNAAIWREIFATKGLKDNEIKQLISLAISLEEDVLAEVLEKTKVAGKVEPSKILTEVFNLVAKTVDEKYTTNPTLVDGWDMRYFPYILVAQKGLTSDNKALLNNLLIATFEGRYKEFLFDGSLPNGKLNLETQAIYKAEGLDFETWMNFDKEHKFTLHSAPNTVDDVQNLVTSTIADLNVISQNAKLAPILANYLKQSGVLFENESLTDLSGHSLNAEKLQTLTQSLIQFTKENGRIMKEVGILDIRDHLLVRQKALKQTNKVTPSNKEFTIRLWKRDPKHDLFQGHYCGCCISLNGINKQAIVQSLTHVVDNTVELVDAAGETVGKAKVLWMKDNKTGEPVFLVNGFEIVGDCMYNNQVRDEFTEFFKEYSKAVAGKEVPIVTGIFKYQKVKIDDLEDFSTNINMLGKYPGNTYHLDTFIDQSVNSHPIDLDKSKDLTTKVLYKPVSKNAHKFEEAQELVNKAIVNIRETINTKGLNIEIPEFTIPTSLKQLEILADNLEILTKKISKDDKIESKLEQVEYALKLLSDENEQKHVRKYAEELHKRADLYAEFLTDCSGKVFADDYEIEDAGAGIWKVKGETPFGTIGGRVKTVDSLYSKLVNEVLDLNLSKYDENLYNAAVRDSYGFRVMPSSTHRNPIVVKDVAQNAAQTHKDSYYGTSGMARYTLEEAIADFYKKGFKGEIWKTLTSDQQHAVRDIVIENRSKAFVDKLISQVKSGFVKLDKISNYTTSFDEKLPYFTANQLGQISDAVEEVTGEKLNIVSFEGGNPKGSTRDCGYTAAQMNMTFANANDVMVECQYRDIEVHDFAELEHVEYDIDQNKITVRGEVYEEHRTLFSDMSKEAKKVNNTFTSDLYAYYHLKALGVEEVEKPDVYKMFDEACAEGKITKDEYDKIRDRLHLLTEVGLQALHK